jgi:hypothetical protein
MSRSTEADRMKKEIEEGKKSEKGIEERDYQVKLQKIKSKKEMVQKFDNNNDK